MQNKARDEELGSFYDCCHRHGLKITPQRIAIYRELVKTRNHPSAEEMYRSVRLLHPNISYDTVNRTLQTFAAVGLVDVVEGIGGVRRYDSDRNPHHHFHCRVCGRIVDFHCRQFDAMEIPDHIRDIAAVDSRHMVLGGVCRRCQSKRSSSS